MNFVAQRNNIHYFSFVEYRELTKVSINVFAEDAPLNITSTHKFRPAIWHIHELKRDDTCSINVEFCESTKQLCTNQSAST